MEIADNQLRSVQLFFTEKLNGLYSAQEILSLFRMSAEWINGYSPMHLHFYPDQRINQSDLIKYEQTVLRLFRGEPIQYIIGYTWFMDLKIFVNQNVLIPRPETEELVNHALEMLRIGNPNIWDMCTGSGCIALALKHYLPEANIIASDKSSEALSCAKFNGTQLGLDVLWMEHDLHDVIELEPGSLDLIISNPPYIPELERDEMATHVKDFEPSMALFVNNNDALHFYNLIEEKSRKYLKSGGLLLVECHYKHADDVAKLFQQNDFLNVIAHNDLSGNPRVVSANRL